MIVVIVSEEDDVDFGEILDRDTGWVNPFGPRPRKGAYAFSENGVCQNIGVASL